MSIFDADRLLETGRWLLWTSVVSGALNIVLVLVLMKLALAPKPAPDVIAVDHGKILGYAQVFKGDSQLGEEMIEDKLRTFIYAARLITPNTELELRNTDTAYAMARGQVTKWLDTTLHSSPDVDPIALAHKGDWRDVNITRVLRDPKAEGDYRIQWIETLHPHMGEPMTSYWEATLGTVTGPTSMRTELNPIALFVISIDAQPAQQEAQN